MAYKHLFIDSDIILDLLFNRESFADYTKILLAECKAREITLSTSTLIIANINYIHSKKTSNSISRETLKNFVRLINILPFESDIVDLALNSSFEDFEDAIQYYIADRYKCELIITRNIKDYKKSTIPVLTAEQFLRTL
ncbi:MAG: PIN domain-containing protein [Mucilaginibacter sp.]